MSVALERNSAQSKHGHQDISIRPYKPLIGAVIENIDLTRPLSDQNKQDLNRALVQHGVIFFR